MSPSSTRGEARVILNEITKLESLETLLLLTPIMVGGTGREREGGREGGRDVKLHS